MRPELLTMQAFGPYKDLTTIDFTKLDDHGIYLLTGPTGAGKTMIFDAIMYALYQTGSGEYRNKEDTFRNRNVPIDVKPFVRLTFSVLNKRYTIERTLRYKAKKDNKNLTDVKVYLKDESNNQLYTNLKEVNDKIIEIMGVDKNQFVQICMIAQGEFKKILNAKTQDRILIFRKLFNSEKYNELQDAILDDYLGLRRKHDDLTLSLYSVLQNVEIDDRDELLSKYLLSDKVDELLNKQIAKDRIKVDSDSEKAKLIDKQLVDIDISINKALQLQKDQEEINKQKLLVNDLNNQRIIVSEKLNKLNGDDELISKIDDQINKINNDLNAYKQLDDLNKKLNSINISIDNTSKKLNKLNDDKQLNDNEIMKLEKIIEDNSDIEAKSLKHSQLLKEWMQQKDVYQKYISDKKILDNDELLLNNKQGIFQDKYNIYLANKALYDKEYDRFLCNQAGILAKDLKDGEACPVCGSTSHVRLAKILDDVYSYEKLDELKKIVEVQSNECLQLSRDIASISAKIKVAKETLDSIVVSDIDEINSNIKSLNALLLADKKNNDKYQDALNKLPLLKENGDKLNGLINDNSHMLVKLISDKDNVGVYYQDIKSKLSYDCLDSANKMLNKLKEQKKQILDNIRSLQEKIIGIDNSISASKAIISTLQSKLADSKVFDIDKLNASKNELNKLKSELNNEIKNTYSILDKNIKILNNIKPIYLDINDNEDKLQLISKINDTINGRSGKESGKIKLETYVQMKFLDEILIKCNLRLMAMTNDQYSLCRHKEADNRQSQTGLDIDVIDHYNNSIRPVSSLSGGESFKASMALALGLSDEIQASSKIKLETLFIDEGFGTLDDESLEAMMNILADLSNSNKLIGIISHVEQLKQRIDKQIVVSKDSHGNSKVKMVI
ncbi:MAG: SMC family ATPase [Erysipelotrichaceae bacterium]|nr:SMC family ATPase [Erysipelotrichaceae bacterium]